MPYILYCSDFHTVFRLLHGSPKLVMDLEDVATGTLLVKSDKFNQKTSKSAESLRRINSSFQQGVISHPDLSCTYDVPRKLAILLSKANVASVWRKCLKY